MRLQPHLCRYWLNPNKDCELEFKRQVNEVCQLYQCADQLLEENIHLISVDEMTGIQALERVKKTKLAKPGQVEKQEFEYLRHGTQSLIGNWHVARGKIIAPTIKATRTELDFVEHIQNTIETAPQAGWIFILDQLNTHCSESLVKMVARLCEINIDLGEKGSSGILKSMSSRREFLSNQEHRIRFVYVPKHTSWLNQIECWFSILVRRLIKRSSFLSTEELKEKIVDFIDYFNRYFSKPFNWKFQGYETGA